MNIDEISYDLRPPIKYVARCLDQSKCSWYVEGTFKEVEDAIHEHKHVQVALHWIVKRGKR